MYDPFIFLHYQPHISPPSGWGLCDGLLSLLLDALNEVRLQMKFG